MIPLALSIAVLDELTRRTCLETSTSLFAAIGTADVDVHTIPHGVVLNSTKGPCPNKDKICPNSDKIFIRGILILLD
jgi:hypothetical protein